MIKAKSIALVKKAGALITYCTCCLDVKPIENGPVTSSNKLIFLIQEMTYKKKKKKKEMHHAVNNRERIVSF